MNIQNKYLIKEIKELPRKSQDSLRMIKSFSKKHMQNSKNKERLHGFTIWKEDHSKRIEHVK